MTTKCLALCLLIVIQATAYAQASIQCNMALAFHQKDKNAKTGKTAVWADPADSSLLFVEGLNVNTDGTRRSYRVDDFWGEKTALNNLCNAMSDACSGLDNDGLMARRVLTQKAAAEGWPRDLLSQTRISPSIIPFKGGKPCPPIDGFMVSATALHQPAIKDACEISNYVDALVTPAIVIPRNLKGQLSEFAKRNARVGDLVVVARADLLEPVFAVVGDTGPVDSLGEGSVALNGRLLKKSAQPVNYREIRGKTPFEGQSWVAPPTVVLIFSATRDEKNPYMQLERIDKASGERFAQWGGVQRLEACVKAIGLEALMKK